MSSDVIAPVFWFLIAGLPALLLSVTLTTAARHLAATGADRAHPVVALHRLLLWLPDRATVALLALTHRRAGIWSAAQVHGAQHGWPAAGLAALLDIAPGHGSGAPAPTPTDIDAAMEALWKLWLCLLALAALLTLL
jgi:cobalamin biosynthesis protein CobD/CbiB